VTPQSPTIAAIRAALRPLDRAPRDTCWNAGELEGLLPADAPTEAAVLVGLVPRTDGLQVLFTRRTGGLRHHAGQVSFPGGRLEPGDRDAAAAALRETSEETGIPQALVTPLGYLDPIATVTGFRVLPTVAVIDAGYAAVPDPREVDEVFEVAFAHLMEPANLRRICIDIGGRSRSVFEFVDRGVPGQRIWGVTASILFNLRERLEATR
jgi:8-oxo-dGTP pyrophosphatase MutT (NUDIX family)